MHTNGLQKEQFIFCNIHILKLIFSTHSSVARFPCTSTHFYLQVKVNTLKLYKPLFSPSTNVYMDRRPNTLRKYQEAEDTHDASKDTNSMPRCSMGLNLRVRGNGTLAGKEGKGVNILFSCNMGSNSLPINIMRTHL